jgi:hypothetical protein
MFGECVAPAQAVAAQRIALSFAKRTQPKNPRHLPQHADLVGQTGSSRSLVVVDGLAPSST